MPDFSVALALLRKPIEALYQASSGHVRRRLALLRADSAIKQLHQKLNAVQKVKTIWNVDRATTLSSFYYPASIRSQQGVTQQLDGLDDLPSNHVVLAGTVGQGKSILLRWLVGRELRSGERMPLLVELRKVNDGELWPYLVQTFGDLVNETAATELLEAFAGQGRISFLLDGFDEIAPGLEQRVIQEIERLVSRFPLCRVVITSRPGSAIESLPVLDVVAVARLSRDDLPRFFAKIMSRDKEYSSRLVAAIHASPLQVAHLVSTPLLATLLAIVYRAKQKVPVDFAEFYDELFQVLLVRHDRTKPGYERARRTKLSDRELQRVFEAFCFKTRVTRPRELTKEFAGEIAKKSIEATTVSCAEQHFLDDIRKITCLLADDGGNVEFVHQSVQEFFAARYVKSRPEDVAKAFYSQLHESYKWRAWEQVLQFLAQIDEYRASRYFYIPDIEKTLGTVGALATKPAPTVLRNKVSDQLLVRQVFPKREDGSPPQAAYFAHRKSFPESFHARAFENRLGSILWSHSAGRRSWRELFDGVTEGQEITYTNIAEGRDMLQDLDRVLGATVQSLLDDLKKYKGVVHQGDASRDFMQM